MKRLILMRHAKSDWSGGTGGDHDRPLNPRGRQAAAELGNWMQDTDLVPDEVLVSDAMRTRETVLRLALPTAVQVRLHAPLYLASPDTILRTIQGAEGRTVLIVGHNPGIAWTAKGILASEPQHSQFTRYPTGATLVADLDIATWTEAAWGVAKTVRFVVPKEL